MYGTETDSDLIGSMIGQMFTGIRHSGVEEGDEQLVFRTATGRGVRFYHYQDCCEHVRIEDICGDLYDLIGSPLTLAEEVDGEGPDVGGDSFTWTFYKFATVKGSVTVRWLGESNGYYSESVSVERLAA